MKKKIIGIIIGILIILLIIASIMMLFKEKKLICESEEASITITYNKIKLIDYKAEGVTYDLEDQKELAKELGTKDYIEKFSQWFSLNTTGSCKN